MLDPEPIPLEKLLCQLSRQWTIHILWLLDVKGKLRFGEIKRQACGISAKVLTQRLRMLEKLDIICRHYTPTIPPQVSYELSDRGKKLSKPLYELCNLASSLNLE